MAVTATTPIELVESVYGTLPGVDQAFGPQFIQRLADGHPGGAVRSRQLRFRRQHAARGELALGEPSPQVDSDIAVSDGAHLSHSCML